MSDEPVNLMLVEHLKSIRASQDRIETRLDGEHRHDSPWPFGDGARTRPGTIGRASRPLAEQSVRFDRVELRLARIAPW